jgi:shikimate kinase
MKNIIIYWMRWSWKSTIWKLLAKKLNKSFYDLDKYIESIINLKLKNYIESNSWESFRCLENKCLSDILNTNENFVLSLWWWTIIPNPI